MTFLLLLWCALLAAFGAALFLFGRVWRWIHADLNSDPLSPASPQHGSNAPEAKAITDLAGMI